MEVRCYRKILHISFKDHVSNEEVLAKIQLAIGPHEDLLTTVNRRGMDMSPVHQVWPKPSCKAQTGRQKKTLKDNIMEWTGPEFAKSQRAMENREKWRKLVVKWLRDR